MLRLLTALALALAVALPVAASASGAPLRDAARSEGTLEIVDGSGRAYLALRGAVLGSLDRGRITVMRVPGRRADILVLGYEWQRTVGVRTTIYGGTDLRFRAFRGPWRLRLQGRGIDASAVGRGIFGLGGGGLYAVDGTVYREWPDKYRTFALGATQGPGAPRGRGR